MPRALALIAALAAMLLLPATAQATNANGNHASYVFLAGEEPVEGPDMAAGPGGTIALAGSGSFRAGPNKSASGGGDYTLTDAAGNTSSGTWNVVGVLGFVNYGDGAAQGAPGVNGGQLQLMIALSNGATGVLTVTCLLGSPPAGMDEGVTLVLGQGGAFTKSTRGETAFIPV